MRQSRLSAFALLVPGLLVIVGADPPSKPACCSEILPVGPLEQDCARSMSRHSIRKSAPVACKAPNPGMIAQDSTNTLSTRAWIGLLA